jgi:hypothetical protein
VTRVVVVSLKRSADDVRSQPDDYFVSKVPFPLLTV